jgi:hypothetical protein
MIHFKVKQHLGELAFAAGSQTGERHALLMRDQIREVSMPDGGLIFVVDFDEVEHATASYMKNSLLWLTLCGQMYAGALGPEEQRSRDWTSLEPLNVFPAVLNANADIQHEIDEVFGGRRGLACLLAESVEDNVITVGKVLGAVDPVAARTIKALQGVPEATAEDLYRKCPDEGVNITAWSNRLFDLNRIRIARRRRQGKFWKYQPLAGVMKYG